MCILCLQKIIHLSYQDSCKKKKKKPWMGWIFYVSESIYGGVWAYKELLLTPTHGGLLRKWRMLGKMIHKKSEEAIHLSALRCSFSFTPHPWDGTCLHSSTARGRPGSGPPVGDCSHTHLNKQLSHVVMRDETTERHGSAAASWCHRRDAKSPCWPIVPQRVPLWMVAGVWDTLLGRRMMMDCRLPHHGSCRGRGCAHALSTEDKSQQRTIRYSGPPTCCRRICEGFSPAVATLQHLLDMCAKIFCQFQTETSVRECRRHGLSVCWWMMDACVPPANGVKRTPGSFACFHG